MLTARASNPPSRPALIDDAHHYLVEANAILLMVLREIEAGEDRLALEQLIDGCEETIERLECVIANREAELTEM
jgi:hypothetical protein